MRRAKTRHVYHLLYSILVDCFRTRKYCTVLNVSEKVSVAACSSTYSRSTRKRSPRRSSRRTGLRVLCGSSASTRSRRRTTCTTSRRCAPACATASIGRESGASSTSFRSTFCAATSGCASRSFGTSPTSRSASSRFRKQVLYSYSVLYCTARVLALRFSVRSSRVRTRLIVYGRSQDVPVLEAFKTFKKHCTVHILALISCT